MARNIVKNVATTTTKHSFFYVGFNMFMGTKTISLTDIEAMGDHDPIVPEISYANN
jgi:hypothetical protein